MFWDREREQRGWDEDGLLPPPESCYSSGNWQNTVKTGQGASRYWHCDSVCLRVCLVLRGGLFKCVCVCVCTPQHHIMLFQFSTRFPCSRERVVFQETQSLEIYRLLGENLSCLLFFVEEWIWQSHNWGSSAIPLFLCPTCLHCSPHLSDGPRWIQDIFARKWSL